MGEPLITHEAGGNTIAVKAADGGQIHGQAAAAGATAQAAALTALTDSTGGTADDTVADVGASFNQATLNNNFADLIAKINALRAAVRNAGLIAQ